MRKNKAPTRQIDYAKGIAALKMLILLTVELQIRQDDSRQNIKKFCP